MVSSVQNNIINIQSQNPFGKGQSTYYITPKTAQDIFVAGEKDRAQKRKRTGLIIVTSALAAAIGIFAIVKGLPKNTYKWLQKWSRHLENNVNARKSAGKSGPVTTFYNKLFKNVIVWSEKAKGVNNIGSFKDLLFTKVMHKNKFTRKIHEKITTVFERLARRSVVSAYKTSDKKFAKLFDTYSEINKTILKDNPERLITINNVTKKASEWVDELVLRQGKIRTGLNEGFGKNARLSRYKSMKKATTGLEDKVWDVISNKKDTQRGNKILTTFIAEDAIAADKLAIMRGVDLSRNKITHNILDNYNASSKALDNISAFLDPSDKTSYNLLKDLRSKLITYKKLSGPNEKELREKVNEEILAGLKSISERLRKTSEQFDYNKSAISQVTGYIDEIENILGKSSKGEMQEILTIYKRLLPQEQYVKLRGKTNKTLNSLDKAIKTENDLFYDKLRDLKLGSGPTDVLSLVGSVGGVGLGLTTADNKDERISATLEYGIPIIGSVATSIALTVGLVAGIKAMVISGLSGMAMNIVGSQVDKSRKQYNKKQEDIKHAEVVKAEINTTNV